MIASDAGLFAAGNVVKSMGHEGALPLRSLPPSQLTASQSLETLEYPKHPTPAAQAAQVARDMLAPEASKVAAETPAPEASQVAAETPAPEASQVAAETPAPEARKVAAETPAPEACKVAPETLAPEACKVAPETPAPHARGFSFDSAWRADLVSPDTRGDGSIPLGFSPGQGSESASATRVKKSIHINDNKHEPMSAPKSKFDKYYYQIPGCIFTPNGLWACECVCLSFI